MDTAKVARIVKLIWSDVATVSRIVGWIWAWASGLELGLSLGVGVGLGLGLGLELGLGLGLVLGLGGNWAREGRGLAEGAQVFKSLVPRNVRSYVN